MNNSDTFTLSLEETKQLQKFLYDIGYISYEFHQSIHDLLNRIDQYLKNVAKRDTKTT